MNKLIVTILAGLHMQYILCTCTCMHAGLSLSFMVQGPDSIGLGKLSTFWVNLGNLLSHNDFKKLLKHLLMFYCKDKNNRASLLN